MKELIKVYNEIYGIIKELETCGACDVKYWSTEYTLMRYITITQWHIIDMDSVTAMKCFKQIYSLVRILEDKSTYANAYTDGTEYFFGEDEDGDEIFSVYIAPILL